MTRLHIDWDGDGAYAVVTRLGQAAEMIRLSHRDAVRLMSEAAGAVLMEEERRQKAALRSVERREDPLPHFIGALGE